MPKWNLRTETAHPQNLRLAPCRQVKGPSMTPTASWSSPRRPAEHDRKGPAAILGVSAMLRVGEVAFLLRR